MVRSDNWGLHCVGHSETTAVVLLREWCSRPLYTVGWLWYTDARTYWTASLLGFSQWRICRKEPGISPGVPLVKSRARDEQRDSAARCPAPSRLSIAIATHPVQGDDRP